MGRLDLAAQGAGPRIASAGEPWDEERAVLSGFWEGVGGKLADRWAEISIPALLFWAGGCLAWAWHAGGLGFLGRVSERLSKQGTLTQLVLILGALLGVLASAAIVDRLSAWALRILEGYWPRVLS